MRPGKRWLLALTVFAMLLTAVVTHALSFGSTRAYASDVQRDVTYCKGGGVDLKMDVYLPNMPGSGPVPVAMYVHGGAWSMGDKQSGEGMVDIPELLSRHYLVVSVNYRLAPEYKWPAQIEDVKCAVRYLRANAGIYNLDPNRIGVWGDSAGGQLVAMLGVTGASEDFQGTGGYQNESSRVQAVVDFYGPCDLTAPDFARAQRSLVDKVFGSVDNLAKASPVNYISRDDPPFLIFQGDKDGLVPPSQSEEMYKKLVAGGVQAKLIMVKNAGHGFVSSGGSISPSRSEITKMLADFFDQNLGGQSGAQRTVPLTPMPALVPAPADTPSRMFSETGKMVSGRFLEYWDGHGGLAQQGFPISNMLQERSDVDGKTYAVQYFERAVFEYHPENQQPYDVLLSLLGDVQYKRRYGKDAPGQVPNNLQGSVLFSQTGKRLGGKFLDYWNSHGGLMQQGYPISDELQEVSPVNGKRYMVQYFERAVFEYHPENKPPYDVLLSHLGTFRYKARYGGSDSSSTPTPTATPPSKQP